MTALAECERNGSMYSMSKLTSRVFTAFLVRLSWSKMVEKSELSRMVGALVLPPLRDELYQQTCEG